MPRWFVSSWISDRDLILNKNGVSSGIELEAGFIQIGLRGKQRVIETNKQIWQVTPEPALGAAAEWRPNVTQIAYTRRKILKESYHIVNRHYQKRVA